MHTMNKIPVNFVLLLAIEVQVSLLRSNSSFQLYKSTLAIGRINRGSDTGYLFSQDSTDFLNFNLGYQFDLYWYDIPLGSFDVGLGFDIYKNKITGSSEKDPRLYVAWVNSLDLSEQKVRDFSEIS